MRIPKRLKIGALTIKISRKRQRVVLGGRECRGYFDPKSSLIWIHPESDDEKQTFWHEFFHAAVHDSGIQQVEGWSSDIEEVICEKFGRYVAEFLKAKR